MPDLRIFSISVLLGALALASWSVYEIAVAESRGTFVATVGSAYGAKIDRHDWAAHWRTSFAQELGFALIAIVSSAFLWRRRPAGLAVLGTAVALKAIMGLALSSFGYPAYAFEQTRWPEATLFFAISAALLFAYIRVRHQNRGDLTST